ncbi:MAG: response regulator [Gammaproteobacteria bacterium]|nr:response regulator [Gammaproteobacteria bacterium]MBQ0839937.1 response regulator [Gammaproteobacteria bacterium]
MAYLKNLSIAQKIIAIVMFISLGVLLSLAIIFGYFSLQTNQQNFSDSLVVLSKTIGVNARAAIVFKDPDTGVEILKALEANSDIASAQLYDNSGNLFASYLSPALTNRVLLEEISDGFSRQEILPGNTVSSFRTGHINVVQPLNVGEKTVGYIAIQGNLSAIYQDFKEELVLMGLLYLGAVLVTYLLARRLQRIIAAPIEELAETMQSVSAQNNYTLRLKNPGNDELGSLFNSFNQMLEQIQGRDQGIKDARNTAQAANKSKTEFLANMSHEIRTPMNGVLGMAELLDNTPLNTQQKKYIQTIRRSGETLLSVINDILDFSKVEAGELSLEEEPFELELLISHVLELFQDLADRKQLVLKAELPPSLPADYIGDSMRLTQILMNLVANAIKFTSHGQVILTVSLVEESSNNAWLCFSVNDSGIGIAKDKVASIFEAFQQADGSISRQYGGTGLGLAISSQLIKLFGGELNVESKLGLGSTFSFTIPLGKSKIITPPTQGEQAAEPDQPQPTMDLEVLNNDVLNDTVIDPTNGKILVAEDNPVNQMLACDMLEQIGYDTDVANDGQQAFDAASKQRYSLIMMDIQMPQVDGLEATALIREHEETLPYRTPIAAVTANAMAGDKERFLASGMDDYLSKPFGLQSLADLVGRWVKPADSDADTPTNTQPPVEGALDATSLKNLSDYYCGAKWPRFQQLIAAYKESADTQIIRLKQAVADADADAIRQAAHSLKSSSGNLAALKLAQSCALMEAEARADNTQSASQYLQQVLTEYEEACSALNQLDYS